jgi:hypothetical protein
MKRFLAALVLISIFFLPAGLVPRKVGLWFYVVVGLVIVLVITTLIGRSKMR